MKMCSQNEKNEVNEKNVELHFCSTRLFYIQSDIGLSLFSGCPINV